MRRYLFVGGPWDGQWSHTDSGHAWLMPDPDAPPHAFPLPSDQHAIYCRRSVWVPGWLVPLDLYVLDGITEIERSVILPGFAYGQMVADPVLSWEGLMNSPSRLRDAVTAFNRERLAR